ncbi:MAG: murein biosynthesis integral membrane protein MurJ [Alphaproteobacteria bacterium]|nr:murein biosynthesis integral membrane protein MurJ [Alphaproteobacteria bacterium]
MSFARSLFTVSGLTAVSRVGGYIRDTLTAAFLGAGAEADAFFVAQRLPNLFRSLFAEGAFSAAFVPLYTSEQEKHGPEAAQIFAGQALMALLAALIPFSIIVMMFMPQAMFLLAPGFESDPGKFNLAATFSTITFPYLALISITALQTGVLNARGRFGPGAAAPIALNIVLILGLIAAHYFKWDVGYALAWSLTISGAVQCAWLAISCWRARASIPLLRPHLGEASRKLFRRIGPGALGAGAAQINLAISTNFASHLPGAVSYLFYADRLNQLPLGIVGVATATTLLPLLSRYIATGDHAKARHFTGRAIEFSLLLGLPAMIGLATMSRPIVQILFQHGAFTHDDTVQTVHALRAYAFGIPGFLLVKVFAAGFFARHDTKTPVKIALIALATNVICAYFLRIPFQHTGIALANSIATTLNAALLYLMMRRHGIPAGNPDLGWRIAKILFCALLMTAASMCTTNYVWNHFSLDNIPQESLYLSGLIAFATLVYGTALHAVGAMRWRDALAILRKKPVE